LHDSRVCAVVLTYQPNVSSLVALLQRIVPQVDAVFLVDNGSSATIRAALAAALRAFPSVRTLMLEDNVGVGAGHNRGISLALKEGFAFVVILDQDSTPAADMIAQLRHGYETASRGGMRVAGVGPRFVQKLTGSEAPFIQLGLLRFKKVSCRSAVSGLVRADFMISSGSLIPQEAFREVGLMREDLFIDQVDTEWFLRARKQGWRMYGVCAASMEHALGDKTLQVSLKDIVYDATKGDFHHPNTVAVINEATARAYFSGESPLGKQILGTGGGPWKTVVGVVADTKNRGLNHPPAPEAFVNDTAPTWTMDLLILARSLASEGDLARALQCNLHQPVAGLTQQHQLLDLRLGVGQLRLHGLGLLHQRVEVCHGSASVSVLVPDLVIWTTTSWAGSVLLALTI